MSQSQGQTDFGPPAREELEEDGQNDFILPTTDAEAAPPADAADGSPNEMRLPPAVAEIQFELRRMKLVVGGHGSRRRMCTSTRNTLVKTSSVS